MSKFAINTDHVPRSLGFLLIDGFALMSYASVIEPFRAANVLAGIDLYRWIHVSADGGPARASTGASITADVAVGGAVDVDLLFLVVGGDPATYSNPKISAWLRALARAGVHLAGVAGGPFLLAKAGLLDGYRCTIHWDLIPSLIEQFPTLMLEQSLYVIDRSRLTCAGGSAGLDLAIDVIDREHGHALAVEVSEWFLRTQARPADDAQRMSLRERYNVTSDRVLKVLAHMEATIEEPEDAPVLARIAGVSQRQIERLFQTQMHATIKQTYRRIRLEHAAILLRKTGMSVTAVATACGFGSSSHFSRAFRTHFDRPPRASRRSI